ncbi:MAG: hypothetical protein EOM22_11165 [Gammaproteobacteria bacterium]|nr:hypothetical protein [Gammaproteobacteria bacterium]
MSLFDADAAAEILSDRLTVAAAAYAPGVTFTEAAILAKLTAAEADLARRLRIHLEPTMIFPADTDPAVIETQRGDLPYALEPAYDMTPETFSAGRWGFLPLRSRPVSAVHEVTLAYPGPANTLWSIPADWIRLDGHYGHIQFVPTGTMALAGPLSGYLMSAMMNTYSIPQMIRIRYTAGLVDAANTYPDLIDLAKKMAVLRLIQDFFLPSSGSISADGLSQSVSVDMNSYKDQIADGIKTISEAIHGIRVAFL